MHWSHFRLPRYSIATIAKETSLSIVVHLWCAAKEMQIKPFSRQNRDCLAFSPSRNFIYYNSILKQSLVFQINLFIDEYFYFCIVCLICHLHFVFFVCFFSWVSWTCMWIIGSTRTFFLARFSLHLSWLILWAVALFCFCIFFYFLHITIKTKCAHTHFFFFFWGGFSWIFIIFCS